MSQGDPAWTMLALWRCRHCDSRNVMTGAVMDRHVVHVEHEAGCPDAPTDEGAAEYFFDGA